MADFYWGAIPLLAAALTILTLDLDYRPEISAPKPQDWQRARSLGFFYVISAFVRIRTILYKNFKTWFPTNPWNEYGFQQSSKHSNSKALRC